MVQSRDGSHAQDDYHHAMGFLQMGSTYRNEEHELMQSALRRLAGDASGPAMRTAHAAHARAAQLGVFPPHGGAARLSRDV